MTLIGQHFRFKSSVELNKDEESMYFPQLIIEKQFDGKVVSISDK